MTKKKIMDITPAEKQLFRDAVFDVKPLKSTEPFEKTENKPEPDLHSEKVTIHYARSKPRVEFSKTKTFFAITEKQPEIAGNDVISFARPGLQNKRFSQFKQGKMRIEATLDLHEHTSDEAIQAIDRFLNRCQQRGLRTVCIIHGKGHFSPDNKPVLKNLLNHYLRTHSCVLAFHSAKNKQGGTGAMLVLIKSK